MPAWTARIVEQLREAEFVELAFVAIDGAAAPPRRRFGRLLFDFYEHADRRLFAVEPDALARVDIEPALASVPVWPGARGALDAVDVLVDLRGPGRGPELTPTPRFGVWSYLVRPPFQFWEMHAGERVAAITLEARTDPAGSARALYRSFSATDPTSLHRGRNPAYWKAAEFVLRALADVHRHGWPTEAAATPAPAGPSAPTNAQMVAFLARQLRATVTRRLTKLLFCEEWYVAYRHRDATEPLLPSAYTRRRLYRRLRAPAGRYWADPFVVAEGDGHRLFFEDFDWETRQAVISTLRLYPERPPDDPQVALARPYHLSYPYVFQARGEWYMVPETKTRRAVELFRAEAFPHRWTLERVLLSDVDAADATVFEHDGRWWLFVNIAVPGASIQDELHLFWADSLAAGWNAHPANPIVSDVRRARPAGRLLYRDGELIRPSQDSSRTYGGAIVLNRVTRLTPTDYEETPIARIDPPRIPGRIGTHTFNATGACEVIDGKRLRWRAAGQAPLRRST